MPDQENLAKRELEIARAYADGLSHKDIAEKLFIAPATVRTHINNICRKLGVKTKMQLLKRTASTDTPEQPKRKFAAFRYAVAGAVSLGIMVIGLALAPGKHTIADAPEPPWKTGLIGPANGA